MNQRWSWGLFACVAALAGCNGNTGLPPDSGPRPDAGSDTGGSLPDTGTPDVDTGVPTPDTGVPTPDAGSDAGPPEPAYCPTTPDFGAAPTCPDLDDRTEVTLAGDQTGDTTWDCSHTYRLTNGVFWRSGTLTIQPGTHVVGDDGSYLVMTRGTTLNAVGHPDQTIVFSSSNEVGERDRGDWGGLVMLGDAPINITGGQTNIEGIPATDARGTYGGTNATGSCGHLRFVQIEFAGLLLIADNELNGLTLGGCGSGTLVEYTQSHRGRDDAFEVFGGSPNLHHIVGSGYDDDGFDWDQGFVGNVQYLVLHHYSDSISADPNGFEGDNNRTTNDSTPRSNPTIYNATIIGPHAASVTTDIGMVLRRGTYASIHNVIVTGWGRFGADVRDDSSITAAGASLLVTNSIFGMNTLDFEAASAEATAFTAAGAMNRVASDAMLASPFAMDATVDYTVPESSIAATGGAAPTGEFFDEASTFVGAIGPGCRDWTQGWTTYPAS